MTDPDLTPEAVERLISGPLTEIARSKGMPVTDNDVDTCKLVAATLRALSAAQLLDVSKREAAMMARYDAKLEVAEARAEKAEAERDELKAHNRYWSGEYDVVLAGRADEHDRAEALDAKLKEAEELLKDMRDDKAGFRHTAHFRRRAAVYLASQYRRPK